MKGWGLCGLGYEDILPKFTQQDVCHGCRTTTLLYLLIQGAAGIVFPQWQMICVLRKQSPYYLSEISPDPFLLGTQSHLSLTFQLHQNPSHLNFIVIHPFGFRVFEVFNSHLGTIWRMYSCYSDLSNAPSRERPDWNSIQFCSIFSLRFNTGLQNIFADHNL